MFSAVPLESKTGTSVVDTCALNPSNPPLLPRPATGHNVSRRAKVDTNYVGWLRVTHLISLCFAVKESKQFMVCASALFSFFSAFSRDCANAIPSFRVGFGKSYQKVHLLHRTTARSCS